MIMPKQRCPLHFDVKIKQWTEAPTVIPWSEVIGEHKVLASKALRRHIVEDVCRVINEVHGSVMMEPFPMDECKVGYCINWEFVMGFCVHVVLQLAEDGVLVQMVSTCCASKFSLHIVSKSLWFDLACLSMSLFVYEGACAFCINKWEHLFGMACDGDTNGVE